MKRFYSWGLALSAFMLLLGIACSPVNRFIRSEENLRWEADIALIDSLNRVEPSDQGTVLVTGSSSVRLWDSIHADLAPYRVMQRGYGGAKLSDYNLYAERIIKEQPFKAILVFVANDIHGGEDDRRPFEVFLLYKKLVKTIRDRNPGTPVFWIETTPTPSRWHVIGQSRKANELIRTWSEKNDDLFFISTFDAYVTPGGRADSAWFRDDMLHLNREGYVQWAGIIKEALESAGIAP